MFYSNEGEKGRVGDNGGGRVWISVKKLCQTYQPTDRPTIHPTNQPTDRPTDRRTYGLKGKFQFH